MVETIRCINVSTQLSLELHRRLDKIESGENFSNRPTPSGISQNRGKSYVETSLYYLIDGSRVKLGTKGNFILKYREKMKQVARI